MSFLVIDCVLISYCFLGGYVMKSIDLTPLYRSSIGYDRFASLLDHALNSETTSKGYPPYNIEAMEENKYGISLAVAGFAQSDLDIQVENGVLTIAGKKEESQKERQFLHQGIADGRFERKFNLAEHVEVTGAELHNGLLTITLVKNIPESMKPKQIVIGNDSNVIEHRRGDKAA